MTLYVTAGKFALCTMCTLMLHKKNLLQVDEPPFISFENELYSFIIWLPSIKLFKVMDIASEAQQAQINFLLFFCL